MIPHSFSPGGQLVYAANGFVWAARFDTSAIRITSGGHAATVVCRRRFADGLSEWPPDRLFSCLMGGIAWAPDSLAIYYAGLVNCGGV